MFALRPQPTLLPRAFRTHASKFHCSSRLAVNVGDRIPDVELMENSPGNKVNVAKELKGKGLIIGVPAAFSPACSATHIPGYINFQGLKNAGQVFVVSVNDAFVMKAWAETLDPGAKSGIRFLADPHAAFTQALDLDFDGTAIFGGPRSKRYALTIDDGVVKKVHVEPDNTGLKESVVEKVLGSS
ncbi:AhpC/TSA family protein [Viridothelium virens]|uniref:AhpC/TSA family protein n=1 Tax=Viridothelium virens TaxID=1048519 RepID=A0A6A6HIK4_VIRVR|nr:AhpC/TSA family protein [Viridothelium virens]